MRRPSAVVPVMLAAVITAIAVPVLAQEPAPRSPVGPRPAVGATPTDLLAQVAGLLVTPTPELGIRESGLLRTTAIGGDEPGAGADPLEIASFQAMVDELGSTGVAPDRITVAKWWAEDADDRLVFAGHGIRVPGADTETVLDAFLSWVTHECCPEIDGAARIEAVHLGGRQAFALSFSGDGYRDVDYILAAGDSAIWLDTGAQTAEVVFAALV